MSAPTSIRRDNLPAQLTSFIGREHEIEAVRALLEANRLVTLTGHGGAGKTRLALEIAALVLENYPDGVWLVELASLADPDLVPQIVASALGLLDSADKPHTETIKDYLRDRRILLILDNCEHLAEACAVLAEQLLGTCPQLSFLASSREVLGVMGEVPFLVPPLAKPESASLPGLDEFVQYDAVRLFSERARTVKPDFEITTENASPVSEIVTRLDGVPLAIELAAARLRVLSPAQIAQRLDDAFRLLSGGSRTALPRHQTLRASLDWSYTLLDEPEQTLLRRLSVFAGSWRLSAAEQVCADPPGSAIVIQPEDVLELLSRLVDKSLIHTVLETDGLNRFQMLEIVRQYAGEKLAGEIQDIRDRHLAYYLDLVETSEIKLRGKEKVTTYNLLSHEQDNLRLALAWALERHQPLAMLRMVSALHRFWLMGRQFEEGRRWCQDALNLAAETEELKRSPWRARAMLSLGRLLEEAKESLGTADSVLAEAESIFRETGDRTGTAHTLYARAQVEMRQNSYIEANRQLDESLEIARAIGDRWLIRKCLFALGSNAGYHGDHQAWRERFEDALAIFQETGNQWEMDDPVNTLAYISFFRGETVQARRLLAHFAAEHRKPDGGRVVFKTLHLFEIIAAHLGNFELARSLADYDLNISQAWNFKRYIAMALLLKGIVTYMAADLETAQALLEESLQVGQGFDAYGHESWVHEILGQVYIRQGEIDRGVAMLEKSIYLGDKTTFPDSYANRMLALGNALRLQGDLEKALDCCRESLPAHHGIGFLACIPAHLEGFAKIAALQDQSERAARLFGAAQAGRQRFEIPVPPVDQAEYDDSLASLRQSLGEAGLEQLLVEGRAMEIEAAVSYALEA